MKHVREFHTAFGCPAPSKPTVPPDDRLRLRLRLVLEEVTELFDACAVCEEIAGQLHGALIELESGGDGIFFKDEYDMVKVADALADIDYVVEGMRLELGIDGEPIAAEVHRSNMAKVGATQREDGKILKPPGWTPPDIEGELRKQGWEP